MKKERLFYETILLFLPCHIYFDLEYNKLLNPYVDSEWVEKTFKEEMFIYLEIEFGVKKDDVELVILVSSNTKKFSKHYIVRIKNIMLKNNSHCGAFVRKLRNRILRKYGLEMEKNPFFFKREIKDSTETDIIFFADLGVYTKRRQWRLYGSSKKGDYRPLYFEGETEKDCYVIEKHKFYKSLVQRIDETEVNDLVLLSCFEEDGSESIKF